MLTYAYLISQLEIKSVNENVKNIIYNFKNIRKIQHRSLHSDSITRLLGLVFKFKQISKYFVYSFVYRYRKL